MAKKNSRKSKRRSLIMECNIVNDKYYIIKKIGFGGNGDVYLGKDMESGEEIAAKFEPEDRENLKNEYILYEVLVGTVGELVYWYGSHGSYNVLILEKMSASLQSIMEDNENRPVPFVKAISFSMQLIKTLQIVHSKGIVHFDIKSSNVMVKADEKCEVIHLIDFGSAKRYDEDKINNSESVRFFFERDIDNLMNLIFEILLGLNHYDKPTQRKSI